MPPEHPVTAYRMDLPRPDGSLSVPVFTTLLAFFVAVAVFNLANYDIVPYYATVLSVLWILFVVVGISFAVIEEQGIQRFVTNRIATLSSRHFVEVSSQHAEVLAVRFGFKLFNVQFTQFQIPSTKLVSIAWSAGQATGISGRDADDWHVVVWYQHKGSRRRTESGYREESLHIIGPSSPKANAVETGKQLVAFLGSIGITFYPTSNECELTTNNPARAI